MSEQKRRAAIVTGAARGIGRGIVLALARHGLDVALVDLRAEQVEATAAEARALGVDAVAIVADTSEYQTARDHVAALQQRWGHIDVLVNNAAVAQPKRILEITEAEWDLGVAVNLKGYFNWAQAVAPGMLASGGGRIVNISSVSANSGPSPHAASRFAYSATKAGVLGLTKGLARELAPSICVNAICPGPILTERTQDSFAPYMDRLPAAIPLGRVGTPEDIAGLAIFLSSRAGQYVVGEVIACDGGSVSTA